MSLQSLVEIGAVFVKVSTGPMKKASTDYLFKDSIVTYMYELSLLSRIFYNQCETTKYFNTKRRDLLKLFKEGNIIIWLNKLL